MYRFEQLMTLKNKKNIIPIKNIANCLQKVIKIQLEKDIHPAIVCLVRLHFKFQQYIFPKKTKKN